MITLIKNELKSSLQFNIDYLVDYLVDFAWLFGIISVWFFFGYKKIEYFLIANFIVFFSLGWEFLDKIDDEVRNGYLNVILTYPINPIKYFVFETIGEKLSYDFIYSFILLALAAMFVGIKIVFVLIAAIFSFFYTIFFYLSFFYASVRTEGAGSIFGLFNSIFKWMLSGAEIPIEFLRKVIPFYDLLPFKYLAGFAFEFMSRPFVIIPGIFWLVIFIAISLTLYKKALKYYYAYGG